MRPVTLYLGGIKDPQVVAALDEIQRASNDTLQNDSSSAGNALATMIGAQANEIPYFTGPYTTGYLNLLNFAQYGLTIQGNANFNVALTDRTIAINTVLTASRTVTLPLASTLVDGQIFLIVDEIGGVTATNTISVVRTSAPDTINGVTTPVVVINSAFGGVLLIADSVNNKWTAIGFNAAGTDVDSALKGQGNANFNVAVADFVTVLQTALTAPRTATLPAANTCVSGQIMLIMDEIGGVTSTNTLTLARTGADTINGAASVVGINSAFGGVIMIPDGALNKWTVIPFNASSSDTDNALTPHGDTNFVMVAADTTSSITAAYTAARTGTLPAANAVAPGAPYLIGDQAGGVTKAFPLTLARAGADTVNGATSMVAIDNPNNAAVGFSDGVSKWSVFSLVSRFIQPFTGAINRTLASIFSDWPVRPQDFSTFSGNPVGTGFDDTQAIQAAINTGKSVYLPKTASGYLLNSAALNCTTPGQLIYGDGIEGGTIINVGTGFSGIGAGAPTAGTNGIFKFNSGEPGPHLKGLTIAGAQPNNVTTSASSNAIGTGSKTFTVAPGLTYLTGAVVYIFDTANPANSMQGSTTSYSGTTLVVNVSTVTGSGTFTTWTIQAASLANLNQYPPAIWCAFSNSTSSQARFILEDILIYGFPTGIDMRGNNGGAYLRNVWLGCLGTNIMIDGCLDVVQIDNLRIWPFGLVNSAQSAIFTSAGTVGIQVYRCDGLYLSNAMFLCNNQMSIDTSVPSAYSAGGGMFGSAEAAEFDSFNGIIMNDAAGVGGSTFSAPGAFFSMGSTAFISANCGAGHLNLPGAIFNCQVDQTALACGGGILNAPGCTFVCGNFARTAPVINIGAAGLAILVGCSPDGPTVSGTFIKIAADNYHRVGFTGNNAGWTNLSAPAATKAVYANN